MNFLNGKKTIIAAALGIICSTFVLLTGEGVAISSDWNETIQSVVALLTIIFGGAGLTHKALKCTASTDADADKEKST